MGAVTIFPSVIEDIFITEGKGVTEWTSVVSGTTSSAPDKLMLMTGSDILLMNGNFLGLMV